jgi:hypothetical protein
MKWCSPWSLVGQVALAMVKVGRKRVRTVASLAAASRGTKFSIVSGQSRLMSDALSVSIRRVTCYRKSSDVFVSELGSSSRLDPRSLGSKLCRDPGNLCRREVAGRIGAFLKPDGNRITRCYRVKNCEALELCQKAIDGAFFTVVRSTILYLLGTSNDSNKGRFLVRYES